MSAKSLLQNPAEVPSVPHTRSLRTFIDKYRALDAHLLSLLRIVAAFVFVLAGTTKLFAFPRAMLALGATAPLLSELGVAGLLEIFGGGLVLLGWHTRPAAFVLSGEMAVAYFQAHFPQSFWPSVNGGTPALLFCFLWLYISAAGAGPISLDARRRGGVDRGCPRSRQDAVRSDLRSST